MASRPCLRSRWGCARCAFPIKEPSGASKSEIPAKVSAHSNQACDKYPPTSNKGGLGTVTDQYFRPSTIIEKTACRRAKRSGVEIDSIK